MRGGQRAITSECEPTATSHPPSPSIGTHLPKQARETPERRTVRHDHNTHEINLLDDGADGGVAAVLGHDQDGLQRAAAPQPTQRRRVHTRTHTRTSSIEATRRKPSTTYATAASSLTGGTSSPPHARVHTHLPQIRWSPVHWHEHRDGATEGANRRSSPPQLSSHVKRALERARTRQKRCRQHGCEC